MLSLDYIEEPLLEFGFGQCTEYPRDGLYLFGPIKDDVTPETLRCGVIGTPEGIRRFGLWSDCVRGFIKRFEPPMNPDAQHHTSFPGFEAIFGARWPVQPTATIEVSPEEIKAAIFIANRYEAVKSTVDLFVNPLIKFTNREEIQPQFWFVVIPEIIYRLGRPMSKVSKDEQRAGVIEISRARARRLQSEPSLFSEEGAQAEVYRYARNFRRQLKARLLKDKIVTQIVRETTLTPDEFKTATGFPIRKVEDPATIAWKLCTTAYYKAGGKPWQLANVRSGVCYVGLVYKQTDPEGERANACCAAQMFLTSGDGIVFRGAVGPWYTPSRKEYHLDREAASQLMALVVEEYMRLHGCPPSELFIHGRARFNNEEWEGFGSVVPTQYSAWTARR